MRHFQKLNKVIFLRNTLNKLYKIIIESINIYCEYQYPLLKSTALLFEQPHQTVIENRGGLIF